MVVGAALPACAQAGASPQGPAEFAPPTRIKAGDAWLGAKRLYPSPVLHDVNGDRVPDVVVGDLFGKVTVALGQRIDDGGLVLAGYAPFAIPGKMTAPRLVDWDGDGDLDLIAGSFGDSYGGGVGGGVYLSLNRGEKGRPAFAPIEALIPPSKKGGTEPTRPDAGLYADAVDYDGDGDLDLIVGGYSMWKPAGRELSAAEQATVAELKEKQADLRKRQSALSRKINEELAADAEGLQPDSQEYRDKRTALYAKYRDPRSAMTQESRSLKAQLDALVPSDQREGFVWLYERQ